MFAVSVVCVLCGEVGIKGENPCDYYHRQDGKNISTNIMDSQILSSGMTNK